jgi:hypothetical protein
MIYETLAAFEDPAGSIAALLTRGVTQAARGQAGSARALAEAIALFPATYWRGTLAETLVVQQGVQPGDRGALGAAD